MMTEAAKSVKPQPPPQQGLRRQGLPRGGRPGGVQRPAGAASSGRTVLRSVAVNGDLPVEKAQRPNYCP